MKKQMTLALAGAALTALALAGCSMGATATGAGGSPSDPGAASAPSAPQASGADLAVADSSIGRIVVDGTGMTAYYFDTDTPNSGKSSCTGECATLWPAIETTAGTPTVDGVTGTVGTITGTDGNPQITIDGRPIYTFASDTAPGDTNGQGVGGIWFAVSPSGDEITDAPAASSGY